MLEKHPYPLLIKFNPVIFNSLLGYLKPKKEDKILDLGCAQGVYVKEIEKHTNEVIGIDNDVYAIEKAGKENIKQGDATNLDFKDNSFDKIYSLNVIEHIPDLKKFFSEIERVLRPEGIVVLAYPWELIKGIQALVPALFLYKNAFMAKEIHLHKLNPKKIKELIKGTSFVYLKSKFILTSGFHYMTVLKKVS